MTTTDEKTGPTPTRILVPAKTEGEPPLPQRIAEITGWSLSWTEDVMHARVELGPEDMETFLDAVARVRAEAADDTTSPDDER